MFAYPLLPYFCEKSHVKMNCVDMFSGCGGLSLGFESAGFDIRHAFDNWKPAINVYKKNFNHPILDVDLRCEDFIVKKLNELAPEIIIGGPPSEPPPAFRQGVLGVGGTLRGSRIGVVRLCYTASPPKKQLCKNRDLIEFFGKRKRG